MAHSVAPTVNGLPRVHVSTEAESSADIKLLLLNALRRRWLFAVTLGAVFGFGAAIAAWNYIPSPYTAFAEIRIHEIAPKVFDRTDDGNTRFETLKETHMRLVTSPDVLTKVLRRPQVMETQTLKEQEYPMQWLEDAISVRSPANEFIRISLTGTRPEDLKLIVQAVNDAYMTEVVDKDKQRRNRQRDELANVYSEENADLENMVSNYRDISLKNRTANDAQRNKKQAHLLDMHLSLRKQLADVKMQLITAKIEQQARQSRIDPEETQPEVEIPDALITARIEASPEYRDATRKVDKLTRRLERYRETLAEGRVERVEAEAALKAASSDLERIRENLKSTVVRELGQELVAESDSSEEDLSSTIQSLTLMQEQYQGELDNIKLQQDASGGHLVVLEELDKDIAHKEELVRAMENEIERLRIESGAQPRIERYRDAEMPVSPDMKKRLGGTAMAGLGAFGLIVVGVAFLEYRTTRISSLTELKDLNLRVVGYVPAMPRYATNGAGGWRKRKTQFWRSVLAESIDSTRTVLLNETDSESLKTIMITSAMQGEGKSTLSCHLATSLSKSGRRVVLVDCDLRRPSISRVFEIPVTPGVCEILRGEATIEECLHSPDGGSLTILPAGRIDRGTSRLLSSGEFGQLIKELEARYDFIVVDSSPLLVNDALLVAQHVGGVLFSIRKDVSRARKVAASHHRLSMVGARLLGAVVIGLDADCDYHRYDYYSRYYSRPVLETTASAS